MADTAILDSLIPAQPIVSARPSATSILDSLLAGAGATPVEQPPPSQYPVGPGQISGMRANLGARMHEGVVGGLAQVAGAPADVALNAPNFLLRTLGLPQIPSGSESIKHALSGGIVGFPTEQIVPGNAAEAYLGKAASGVGSMLATGGLASAIPAAGKVVEGLRTAASPSGLAMGAGGGVAGGAARRAVPERYGQAAEMAGNAAGMGLTGAGLMAGGKAFRAAGDYVGGMGIGPKETVAGVRVTPAQQRAATSMVNEALGPEGTATLAQSGRTEARARELESILADPKARANERIAARTELDGIQNQREQVVPGHEPTLAQIVPSPDVKALEKVSRTTNDAAFGARDAGNNNALVGAVRGLAPETAEPGSVGRFFTAQLDALEQSGEREIAAQRAAGERSVAGARQAGEGAVVGARQAVGQAGEALGGMGTPEAHGEALRGFLSGHEQGASMIGGRLYAAIDPEGKLVVDKTPAIEAANAIRAEFGPGQWNNMPAELAPVKYWVEKIAGSNDAAQRFNDFGRDLQFLGADLRGLRMKGMDPKSTTGHYLGIIRDAMKASIEEAVDRAATQDSGLAARFSALMRAEHGGPVAGAGTGEGNSGGPGLGAAGVPGASGTAFQGRSGSAAGDRPMAVESPARERQLESLHDRVISLGGVQDPGGNFKAADLDRIHHRGGGRLINPRGMHPDKMREALVEEGFLPANADINAFNDAMQSQRPVYRIDEAADASVRAQQTRDGNRESHERFMAGGDVDEAVRGLGVRLFPAEREHATELRMGGMDAEAAVREAVGAGEDELLQRHAERNAMGSPGVPLAARQAEMSVGRPQLTPNMTAEDAARINTANRYWAEKKQTYAQGPVGAVLKGGPTADSFAMETAKVPRAFLTGNAVEPARVQKYIEAVGGLPQAVTAMREALINDLRNQRTRVIMDDGTVSAKGLADWTRNHARTIDQFPGLRDQLGTVEKMQAAYDSTVAAAKEATDAANRQAALELTMRIKGHEQAIKDFNRSPGGQFVVSEAMPAFKRVLASDTRTQDFADIVAAARGKPEVVDGLRRLVADYIEERFGAGPPTGETENLLRPGALRNWIEVRKGPLKEILGGQGIQNLEAVGAVLRRQQLATSRPAVAGSDTASKALSMVKHGAAIGGHSLGPTAFALIGEHLMESAGQHISHSGLMGVMAPVVGIAAGTGLHFLRQAGIRTRNDLVKEMLLNPALTREMQAKVADARLSPLTKTRIARAMLAGTTAAQPKER